MNKLYQACTQNNMILVILALSTIFSLIGCGASSTTSQYGGGESGGDQEQPSDEASAVLGTWTVTEQCENVPHLASDSERVERVEFLQDGKLLIDSFSYTYSFLDSSRVEVAAPASATVVYTISTPSSDTLRIDDGDGDACILQKA